MSQSKPKKTYTVPELTLRGLLMTPEDDFTKTSLKETTTNTKVQNV